MTAAYQRHRPVITGRFGFHGEVGSVLVQYGGEKTVLTPLEYPGISVKSLSCGETTIRKEGLEVPMDHLLGWRWNTSC